MDSYCAGMHTWHSKKTMFSDLGTIYFIHSGVKSTPVLVIIYLYVSPFKFSFSRVSVHVNNHDSAVPKVFGSTPIVRWGHFYVSLLGWTLQRLTKVYHNWPQLASKPLHWPLRSEICPRTGTGVTCMHLMGSASGTFFSEDWLPPGQNPE